MHFEKKDEATLKKWVLQRIAKIYDADPDVLADYTVALVQDSDDISTFRARMKDQLEDLLHEKTSDFVETLYSALVSGSYRPDHGRLPLSNGTHQSRKRSSGQFEAGQAGDENIVVNGHGLRASKAPRTAQHDGHGWAPITNTPNIWGTLGNHTQPPVGRAGTNRHLNAYPPTFEPGLANFRDPLQPGQPCYAYATFGFCAFGLSCPYRHDLVPSLGYPLFGQGAFNGPSAYRAEGAGRGGGRPQTIDRRVKNKFADDQQRRSAIKRHGVNVVMTDLPEDLLEEDEIRRALSSFGTVRSVRLDYDTGVAYIAFEAHDEAASAVSSRQVHWDYSAPPTDTDISEAEHSAAMRRIVEAQIRHSERKARHAARKDVERRLRKQEADRKRILHQLALKQDPKRARELEAIAAHEAGKTDSLRAKLAELRAEAASLGLPSDGSSLHQPLLRFSGSGPNPNAPRGKSAWSTAHRGRPRPKQQWSGGAKSAVMRLDLRPKALRITVRARRDEDGDNGGSGSENEAGDAPAARLREPATLKKLRAFVQRIGPHALLQPADDDDAVVAAFDVRYLAEVLVERATKNLTSQPRIPGVGRVELAWVRADAGAATSVADGGAVRIEDEDEDEDEDGEDGGGEEAGIPAAPPPQQQQAQRWSTRAAAEDVDLDVD